MERLCLFLSLAILLVSCTSGPAQQENLSEYYRIQIVPRSIKLSQHAEIFVLNSAKDWEYLASVKDSQWPQKLPWGYRGIESRQIAISEDGNNLLYVHNAVLAGKKSKKESGLYLYEFGNGEKLVKAGAGVGATRYPKPIPENMLVIGRTVYLADGTSVPLINIQGNAYHQAVIEGNELALDSLIRKQKKGIDENNYWDLSPAQLAIGLKNEKLAIRILEGLSPEITEIQKLILAAATYHCPLALERLLTDFQFPTDIKNFPESPFHATLSYPSAVFSTNILPDRHVQTDEAIATIQVFLEAGWDINTLDKNGATLLFLTQDLDIMEFLFQNGINASIQDNHGNLALHPNLQYTVDDRYADRWEKEVLPRLSLLASHTANIDLPNQEGVTPLQKAVQGNKLRSAEYLISLGANPDVPFIWANIGPNIKGQSIRNRIEYLKKDRWWKEVNK